MSPFTPFFLATAFTFSLSSALGSEPIAPRWHDWAAKDGTQTRGMLMNVTDTHIILLLEDASQVAIDKASLQHAVRASADAFAEKIAQMKIPLEPRRLAPGLTINHGEVAPQLPHLPAMTYDAEFRDGVPHGLAQSRSRTGKLCQVEPHADGQLHGVKVQFYPSGQLYALIFMDHGIPVGIHPRFFPSGLIATFTTWENGEQHGYYIAYHTNGRKKDIYSLVHGKTHGDSVHLTADGTHYGTQSWMNGECTDKTVLREIDAREFAAMTSSNIHEFGQLWDESAP
ncbi:hypothetical protein I41_01390 [Lacipirellula limnantheis]|uniref:SLA1 homology domain-containing protein n=2 Tax=Lacipirellula limnantheis TaxID=2528024 RepID=A0A517TRI3_9BACT|nr:hypothetical protein I41_01390 [Lacipirellula limnantheis]